MNEPKKYWKIEVVDWGILYATGTEAQAEEWRVHKANWEHSIARKTELKTDYDIRGREFKNLSDLLIS